MPSPIETDDGKKSGKNFSSVFLISKYIKRYSGCTSREAVFPERFKRTKHELLEEPIF